MQTGSAGTVSGESHRHPEPLSKIKSSLMAAVRPGHIPGVAVPPALAVSVVSSIGIGMGPGVDSILPLGHRWDVKKKGGGHDLATSCCSIIRIIPVSASFISQKPQPNKKYSD